MQTLNPSEISELIKQRVEKAKLSAEARNEGTVTSVSDGIVRIHGLADVMQGEMIELPGNTFALALNLERDSVGAVVLGDYEHLREGAVASSKCRSARNCSAASSTRWASRSTARVRSTPP
jgi:F-type H+/Na+-transporting ATPase subunit alpha